MGSDAFLRLVGEGKTDEVRAALTASPQLVNAVGAHPFWGGRPQPLHVSIETNQPAMFALLLEAGADVDGDNAQYELWSPLMLAVQRGRTELRDELLRRGARVDLAPALLMADDSRVLGVAVLPEPVPNGGSWLQFARTTAAIDHLLALGASTTAADRWGTTPIIAMSRLGRDGEPLVRHLIARGVAAGAEEYARLGDVNAVAQASGADRPEVLLAAVSARQLAVAEWLVAHGAPVNARATDRSRQTALHEAAWLGDLAMVQLLVAHGADATARDLEHQSTPREWAETAAHITRNANCQAVADYLRARET